MPDDDPHYIHGQRLTATAVVLDSQVRADRRIGRLGAAVVSRSAVVIQGHRHHHRYRHRPPRCWCMSGTELI